MKLIFIFLFLFLYCRDFFFISWRLVTLQYCSKYILVFWRRNFRMRANSFIQISKELIDNSWWLVSQHVCMCDQLCPTLCDNLCSSLRGSSVQGNSQARILKWVNIFFSRGSSQPRDRTCVSWIGKWILYHWTSCNAHIATWKTNTTFFLIEVSISSMK